jgi:ferredoxin
MKNIIFYFSGTGNSLQVAKDISEKIGECEVLNLAKYDMSQQITAERIGIVFPVYFWGMPNSVKAFLKKIKIENNPYIFAVATCGGAAGAALIQVDNLLSAHNLKLHSGFIIRMPENYILYYNADSKEKQQKLFDKEKSKVVEISQVVINKKIQSIEKSKYIVDRLGGKRLNELVVKKFPTKDTYFNLNDKCISCGKCEKVCSVGNITMVSGKPTWNHHCEFCLGCLQSCPVEAINYEHKTQKRNRYINPNISLL